MLQKFIERPVLSTVISIIIVILGVLSLTQLPVTQYPDIAPPTVQVTASYPGASAETILESVIVPIEEQINGVEGMTYMTSTASNTGTASIQVFFEQGYDPDIAAVNVQNRVARANALLPSEVTRAGVITAKQQNSALLYAAVYSTNPEYDDVFIQNYLNINVKPELQRVSGVGAVNVFGAKDYSMRVWLDPAKMASYKLEPREVIAAINEQSLEAAAGSLGQNSGESFEYVIKYKGRYKTAKEYENVVVKALGNGQFLRVKDVAKVELDAFSYSSLSRTNGNPALNFGVFQTPGSNAQEIIENIYVKLEDLKKDFPEGLDYIINYDTNKFLTASVNKVKSTLIEAFLLVFVVVFIFLQDFKSTLIPAIAVPVSIIGTFFFLNLFGYSINLLTLFALILAIGIVVDDAIVVVEAVHAKLEDGAESAKKASISAMSEISGAIVSITLVMVAVFVPITFIQGPSGVFYEQFGVTLMVAILISAVNALTLTPALSALLLKPHNDTHKKKGLLQRFYDAFNAGFNAVTNKYTKSLGFLVKHKWVTAGILGLSVLAIVWASNTIPTGFVPSEDRGVVFMNAELPAGSSLDRSYKVTEKLYESIKEIEGIKGASFISGRNFFSGEGSSYAMGFIILEDWSERESDAESVKSIVGQLFGKAAMIPDANIIFFTPPSVPGFGSADGFEMRLLDRAAKPLTEMDATAKQFVGLLNQQPEIAFASNSFDTGFPQLELDINVERAKEAGVSTSAILSALQGYIGGNYAADFSRFGKQFRVFVQSLPEDRINEESLNSMFIKTPSGEMTPISQFVSLERVYGPQTVNRFNLFNSVTVNGGITPGFSTGDAITKINSLAENNLPEGYSVAYSGITREEIASSGQSTIIFMISILFVYFLLAAQYESYLLPLSVILSLPIGVAGAYYTTYLAGLENNIYFQIALIMLLGLLAKNAILIVEFAIQRRKQGNSLYDAAIEGAKVRLRPILMTSFAFILGLLPLVLAKGVGAEGNNSIGTGAAGGLLIGTLIGVFVIPVLFVIFQWLQEKVSSKPAVVEIKED
ncbi:MULTISPECIES: efflux RND transporter permease subunit [Tenacibaculum]|uniref:Efflux RND transporter permease subunit n=2 Tax=Tenacibaculum TaxID=104267 RepID=A0AAE9MNH0_9FLAO|nr:MULTISPECIES: efflux RND transporter permease subunit [Tenacibaculum]GFD72732.1 multidrug transporter AcrB [Tenacibaculum sp. KUL113]GFD80097.1 multidrug transporter AcrB [Tenacibaculum sp. KUL118]GFD97172.1 multidrug transporter AcrB [Alteromonas sp. KUL154]GFE01796.1 multidrug transporter AcrB [Alteromonas sp. KUL156]AZJ32653.1 hydrophobe/amphiphile efflux-1 family RND transporter [Tenacibaculum mesophilum]